MKYTGTPSADLLDLFPPEAAQLIAEIEQLHDRAVDLSDLRVKIGRSARGGFESLLEDARRQDAALLSAAARAGEDLTAVGTPNVDQLLADDNRLRQMEIGHDGALTAASNDLQAVIRSDAEEIRSNIAAAMTEAADRYAEAIEILEAERGRLAKLRGALAFVDTTVRTQHDRSITFVLQVDQDLDGGGFQPIKFAEAMRGMRNELARARTVPA